MIVNCNEDDKDFISLYNKYHPKIYNFIYRKFFNVELAEDLTSKTFLNTLSYISKKNPKIENFNAFIYKVATNEINMHLRYMKDKKNISIDDESNNLNNILKNGKSNSHELYAEFFAVKNEIMNLKETEQKIIELHFFENLEYNEISEILKLKQSTIRSILHRALKKLKNLLEREKK